MTAISLFRGPLRLALDDWDPVAYRYPSTILDMGVTAIVNMGLLNRSIMAPPGGFSIDPSGLNITPDVITGNPKSADTFALVVYRTAYQFMAPKPDKSMFRTKPLSGMTGNNYRYLDELEAEIHRLENGGCLFEGYQSYFSWMEGMAGLPLGEVLAKFNLQSPLWEATFTRDGMRVA